MSDFDDAWNAGRYGMGPPANGNVDAWQQGNSIRQWNQQVEAQNNASSAAQFAPSVPVYTGSGGTTYGGGNAFGGGGTYTGGGAGVGSGVTGIIVIGLLVVAAPLTIGAAAAALIGGLVVVLLSPLFGAAPRPSFRRAYKASFFGMLLYLATMYVVAHLGVSFGRIDPRFATWAYRTTSLPDLQTIAYLLGVVLLSQVPGVLAYAAVLSKMLRGAYAGFAGYLKACAVSFTAAVTVLAVVVGGSAWLVQQLRPALPQHASVAPPVQNLKHDVSSPENRAHPAGTRTTR